RRTGVEQTQSATVVVAGMRRLYQFSERPLADGWVVGAAQDMSAIDALQTDLTSHIEAHQDVLEQLRAGIAVFDGDRRLRFFNRAYAAIWGLDPDWLANGPLLSEVLESLRQKRRLPEVVDFAEFRRRSERRFQTLLQPEDQLLHLPDGRTLREVVAPHPLGGLLFVLEDVTDRLALESGYNTLIAVQRGILDQLADGVAAFGTDGRLSVANPAFLNVLGLAAVRFDTGSHITDLLDRLTPQIADADAWPAARAALAIAVTNREPQTRRLFLVDGRVLDISCTPLSDGRVLMRVRDISDTYNVERVLLERNAALEEANRLKTDFLANASYELRTPLTTIAGFAELLQSEPDSPLGPRQREYLAGITKASDALAALIDSVLDVSLGEAGQWDAGAADIAVAPIIRSVAAVVRPQIEAQGLELTVVTAPGLASIQADERRLRQLVFNLMTSAARHNRGASGIAVTCRGTDDGVEIAAGIQLPPVGPDRHLFEKELALTLVQRLAVLHGGTLAIDREADRARLVCHLPRRR
ncbi:MAG: PAS-domain containing protein, partial [Alphaproteobacteria bacterium]|nr:PAS-domain containing protein [Alphaproteobacteria bacterium]